ncbi:hypothetical protein Y1Q_0014701 [Alligator mississippiensis]|uniref:Uncharacterized protein n=1 Tax=Alligator mississippiensis TaxID=8496 RepID=A0A151P936_ALLMI|nr:hypothetical protein Y1Q_0014701 [Alligator mississippiensis]
MGWDISFCSPWRERDCTWPGTAKPLLSDKGTGFLKALLMLECSVPTSPSVQLLVLRGFGREPDLCTMFE